MHVMPMTSGVKLLPAQSRKEDVKVLEDHATRLIAALALIGLAYTPRYRCRISGCALISCAGPSCTMWPLLMM